jgi:hypothetical protein
MQKKSHWKKMTNASSRKLLAALVVLLLLTNILGCSHGPIKRKNEIWLVDGETLVLYRVISDEKEQAIPIKNNPAMSRFMCLDKDEVDYWIEEGNRE